MLANLERGKLAADPVQRAWMCGLHLDIPGITTEERLLLADQLAATGDVMRAARELDCVADELDAGRADTERADPDLVKRLRTRVRALRAGMN
jgi:HAMP domain-containing protein